MFKSFAWNLNREDKVIADSLVSCAPITGKFYGRDKRVIPIQHYFCRNMMCKAVLLKVGNTAFVL